jgi:putative hydrolase of the HAD superfamily
MLQDKNGKFHRTVTTFIMALMAIPERHLTQRPPSIVFFDAGNTLLNVHPTVGEVYAQVSRGLGCRVPAEVFESQLAVVWQEHQTERQSRMEDLLTSEKKEYEMWRSLAYALHGRIGGLTCSRNEWFESLHREFGKPERFRMFPEVPALLKKLRDKGVRTGLISNWDSRLEGILDGTGLTEFLDPVVVSSLVGYSKPHRRIFEIALEKQGATAGQAVHVGDSYRDDIEGAKGVGMPAVLIDRKDGITAITGKIPSKPDCPRIASLSELPGLLFPG